MMNKKGYYKMDKFESLVMKGLEKNWTYIERCVKMRSFKTLMTNKHLED